MYRLMSQLVFYWNRRLAKLPTLVQRYSYGLKNVGGMCSTAVGTLDMSLYVLFFLDVRNVLNLHIVNISYYYSLPYKRIERNML